MRILITGASGLIGSAITARLVSRGDSVVAVTRSGTASGLSEVAIVRLDMAHATAPQDWMSALQGVDAVINCAGTLQDSPHDSTKGVHFAGATALFEACERAGIRRVIQLSAVGVDKETPTEFSRSKRAGDEELMRHELDWVILRPSVVVGRAAYGGSALIRGLASLPFMPVMSGTGALQLVHLDDLVEAVLLFLRPDAPSRLTLEVVGPRAWSFGEAVQLFRRWLRWPDARAWPMPAALSHAFYRLGDLVALLGWRPPVRTTARLEIARGATGDPAPLAALGIAPRDVEDVLRAEPASVQERWFARLYFLKPLVIGILVAFWIATGLISLGPGWDYGMDLMREGGVGERVAALAVVAGALADIAIGTAIAFRSTNRWGLWAALAISPTYAVIGTLLVPRLWADPLGPMLKIWPIMVLILVALAIREDR